MAQATAQINPPEQTPPAPGTEKKTRFFKRPSVLAVRQSTWLNLLFCLLVPAITLVTMEWIARGYLGPHRQGNGFFESLGKHFPSFLIAYILLVAFYLFFTYLFGTHFAGTLAVGLIGNIPAVVTFYKLTMRNEPFLPWDILQIRDLMDVKSSVELRIQMPMVITLIVFGVLLLAALFLVRLPRREDGKPGWKFRLIMAGSSLAFSLLLIFGVFMNSTVTTVLGIKEDMWMQDRYYRTNGVITGFLTNLQVMKIDVPEGYSQEAVEEIAAETEAGTGGADPLYAGAPAAGDAALSETPDIIYLMAEAFWDISTLPGVEFDRELTPNLNALAEEGALGHAYSPSYGGGTCDVEFEALTGFSMEHLPPGSKPYQQYVTQETPSLASELKDRGYQTLAIHGYGRRFWNRDIAYPRLGIDTFIASDDFVDPDKRRGFISDEAMVDRILEEQQARAEDGPVFIHAVTMQNHSTYGRDRYPAEDLVRVTKHPDSMKDSLVGELEDYATGIYEMDRALGRLAEELKASGRPTILVFWGDHLNPLSDGYGLFEKTGFIEKDETSAPQLHMTPLLMWSSQSQSQVDLGTLSTYEISPVMMDLYGLEKPVFFEFLAQQIPTLHGRTRGTTIQPDNTFSRDLTDEQQESVDKHALLQYDLLFGKRYLAEESGTE